MVDPISVSLDSALGGDDAASASDSTEGGVCAVSCRLLSSRPSLWNAVCTCPGAAFRLEFQTDARMDSCWTAVGCRSRDRQFFCGAAGCSSLRSTEKDSKKDGVTGEQAVKMRP